VPYPTSTEVRTRLKAIRDEPANAPFCTIVTLLPTGMATPWTYLKIAKTAGATKKFLVTGGVHGHEWVPPGAVLSFAKTLLNAYHGGTGITIGGLAVPDAEIKKVVEDIHIYVAPVVNPDGYDHSLATLTPIPVPYWEITGRKNRRVTPPACAPDALSHDGVNINRNFDIVWDYRVKYKAGALTATSDARCDINFFGGAAFSEPETKNVKTLLDEGVEFFIDCHMNGRFILYSWGIETNQDAAKGHPIVPTMNFANPAHDVGGAGVDRDGTAGALYREHIDQTDLKRVRAIAWGMQNAIFRGTGVSYTPQPGAKLYATTGAADDYAFSRHLNPATPGLKKVLAFTLECGDDTIVRSFQPDFAAVSGFPAVEKELHCAVLHFLVHVSKLP